MDHGSDDVTDVRGSSVPTRNIRPIVFSLSAEIWTMNELALGKLHILTVVTWLPALGALLLLFFKKERAERIKLFANVWALVCFLVSLPLLFAFEVGKPGFQFIEDHGWIPSIGVALPDGDRRAGAGARRPDDAARRHCDALLVELHPAAREGVLHLPAAAPDRHARRLRLARFLPLLRLLGGHARADVFPHRHLGRAANRLYAAIKFFLYTLVGSVLMLLAILKLYFMLPELVQGHGADLSRWLQQFAGNGAVGMIDEAARLAGQSGAGGSSARSTSRSCTGSDLHPAQRSDLALGGLLPRLCDQGADVPVPHLAAGRARRGADGRVGDPRRACCSSSGPTASCASTCRSCPRRRQDARVLRVVVPLAIIGIIYGALLSRYFVYTSRDMKKLVAYSSVSHMGMIMLGHLRHEPARDQRGDPADGQPRDFDERALPARRGALRAAAHADDLGLRGAVALSCRSSRRSS